jgi:omega-6 fatty acid desaturase (delta-12 desaturase)
MQILISDFGIILWLGTLFAWSYLRGISEMFVVYFMPYLWFVTSFLASTLSHGTYTDTHMTG